MKKNMIFGLLFLMVLSINCFGDDRISKFQGDWIGTGWGWEVRFKQTSGNFVSQFRGKRHELPFDKDKIIMTLLVEHSTTFHFQVDENGMVTGEGAITYGLIPNLVGVASLTKQVNSAINMMDKIIFVFKLGSEIGKQAVQSFNRVFLEQEAKLARNMGMFSKISASDLLRGGDKKMMITKLMQSSGEPDAIALAKAVLWNRVQQGGYKLANGVDLSLFRNIPVASELKSLGKFALEQIRGQLLDEINKTVGMIFGNLNKQAKKEELLCLYAAGIPTIAAGTKIGPSTVEELLTQFGPEVAKALIFDIALGKSMPTGLILSIPGVTQVQYYYKGLKNGPESRKFKIKGQIINGMLNLSMDGDVYEGDKNLYVQYEVNYKKETHPFPTWSPFINKNVQVHMNGKHTVYEKKTIIERKQYKDKKTGHYKVIDFPRDISIPRSVVFSVPFAAFHKAGKHRNKVRVWQEYEYIWTAYQLTEPKKKSKK